MIEYRHFTPKKYKCLECNHSPLEIWAFVWVDYRTSKEKSTPVLVCNGATGMGGCGAFFDPIQYGLNEFHKELRRK